MAQPPADGRKDSAADLRRALVVIVLWKAMALGLLLTLFWPTAMIAAILARPRMALEDKGTLVCLAAVVFNRIYSTQFNLWFYPFLLLAAARSAPDRRRTLLLAFVLLDLINVVVYPLAFTGAARTAAPGRCSSPAIVARAIVVAILGVFLLRGPAPASPAGPPE